MQTGYAPLAGCAWYKRTHARLLAHGFKIHEVAMRPWKESLLGSLEGRVVELGPGGGLNLPYFRPDIEWTGVEPNPYFYPYLEARRRAARCRTAIVQAPAEELPFDNASIDAVAATLVFCTVRDVLAALRQVRRVLKPGGRFVFIEHVVEPESSFRKRLQRTVKPIWQILGDGCQPDRDTASAIRQANFSTVDIEFFRAPLPVAGPHIAGWAIR